MDLSERDSSYHRRLTLISAIVVVALATLVLAGQRWIHLPDSVMVGWQGEMELLPELTIEPEMLAAEDVPAPAPREKKPVHSLPTVDQPNEFQLTSTPTEEERIDPDLAAHGVSVPERLTMSRPVSYSETYVILRTVKPKYPEHERERNIEGSVTVELLVDEQGLVAQANALSLVGPMSFQDAALDAVRQFEFQPPVIDGEPSTMWIKFIIKFRMSN